MNYKFIIALFFITSCAVNSTKLENKAPFSSKGFAYIFNENDYNNKIIKGKLDNSQLQISLPKIKINSSVKLINPKTNDSLIVKNVKNLKFPEFYKILITKRVANKLNLNRELPLVEIIEIKKNKSFVAKKAIIYNEEKKISSNAPVTSVQISNISKDKNTLKKTKKNSIYISIATFYSENVAIFLKKRITKEIPDYDVKKLKIIKKSNKEIKLISGPYNTINLVKNDYILLKKFGFEELDISINE